MKYSEITLYDFLLYSLDLVPICPSGKHISNTVIYDKDDFWGGRFSSDCIRTLRMLFE